MPLNVRGFPNYETQCTYIHTDRQSDKTKIIYHAASRVVNECRHTHTYKPYNAGPDHD